MTYQERRDRSFFLGKSVSDIGTIGNNSRGQEAGLKGKIIGTIFTEPSTEYTKDPFSVLDLYEEFFL